MVWHEPCVTWKKSYPKKRSKWILYEQNFRALTFSYIRNIQSFSYLKRRSSGFQLIFQFPPYECYKITCVITCANFFFYCRFELRRPYSDGRRHCSHHHRISPQFQSRCFHPALPLHNLREGHMYPSFFWFPHLYFPTTAVQSLIPSASTSEIGPASRWTRTAPPYSTTSVV